MRRTRDEIEAFDADVREIARKVQPATARQVYYRAVVSRIVSKDHQGYRWVCESLTRQRWAKLIPWSWISDETRAVRAPEAWSDADHGLGAFAASYRRDAWREQPSWIEVWVESDSLAGTLIDATWDLGVPLFSGRGFASLSSLRDAAAEIGKRWHERSQPTAILYIGDLDPCGWEACKTAHKGLLRHLGDASVLSPYFYDGVHQVLTFKRLAVNPEQVEEYELEVGDPPKAGGPGRVSWWKDGGPALDYTVEAEAFEPDVLRALVEDAILEHADEDALERAREVEALERETLQAVASRGLFTELDRDSEVPS